ncbi:MAG: nitroreductase family protein [Betaproteobacteria bacterium]
MLEIIRKRRSVRTFLDKDVEQERLVEILEAAMAAPTARNLRPCEFIVVRGRETRASLSRATNFSAFAKNAPVVIVICYDTNKGRRFKEDCSLAAANIYLETVNQGLGTCFVQIADTEGKEGEPEEFVRKALSVPAHVRIQCLMPLGYPDGMPEPHRDEEYDEKKVHFEEF